MKREGIYFFIHDIHPYGGQDRSTLEILNELSREIPVDVFAYTYENPDQETKIRFHRCPLQIKRPVLLKILFFHAWSFWILLTNPRRLTFSTGTASLISDIVHVQFIANAWREEKRKVLLRSPLISRIYHRVLALYNEAAESLCYTKHKRFIALSRSVAADLKTHFNVENTSVIYHGVDVNKFKPSDKKRELRKKLQLPEEAPLFLFVGAYDRKGLATVIGAAKKLRAKFPDVHLVAVGSGDREKYLELANNRLGMEWLILRPSSKCIEEYYAAADAFVLPTLYEPFGLVILEAMSAGLPVIVSKSAGAAELIEDGRNGVLIQDPTDENALTDAMKALLQHPRQAMQIGKAARITAERRSWKQVAKEFRTEIAMNQMQKILLITFDYPPKRGGIATYAVELENALRSAKYDIRVLNHLKKISSLRAILFYFLQINLSLWRNPDLKLFCTNWYPCGLAAWLSPLRIMYQAPYYLTAHGAEFLEGKQKPLKAWLKRKVAKRASFVFPVSSYTAKKVSEAMGKESARIQVIPNGVNIDRFFPEQREIQIRRERPVVLTVTRLDPHKGVDTAIESLALLAKRRKPFEYWIAGTGKEYSRLQIMSKELGVEQYIRFLGDVPSEALCKLYNDCDLFLLLSQELPSFVEGFGLVFLEAAACGKTCVATRSGGIPDAVLDGETGLLVAPNNAIEAADAIERILDNSSLRETLARTAMERARTQMSWTQVANLLKDAMNGELRG